MIICSRPKLRSVIKAFPHRKRKQLRKKEPRRVLAGSSLAEVHTHTGSLDSYYHPTNAQNTARLGMNNYSYRRIIIISVAAWPSLHSLTFFPHLVRSACRNFDKED